VYLINPRVLLRNDRLIALFAVTFICVFLLTPCVGLSSDPNSFTDSRGSKSVADGNNAAKDSNGPTIMLSYSKETFKENPISSFMYFVPLISRTLVDRETSANNEQQFGIISYERKVTSKSFYVTCEFEVLRKGFHKNTFDPVGMIATHTDKLNKGEPVTDMLDYIKLEGEGFGRIKVKGKIIGSKKTVTEVDIHFKAGGLKSPVTIGFYDIKPKDGQYKYENRYNEIVARVNRLTFKKSEENPRMGITVASINKKTGSDSLLGHVRAAIANLFIKPVEVDKLGNATMLDFGYALLEKSPTFTFPKAKNMKENRAVVTDRR